MLVIALAVALAGCAEWALEQLQPDAPAPPEEVLAAAQAGDAMAAFLAYRQATTVAESRKWVCIAANRGLPEAQAEIARLHWHSFWDPPGLYPFAHDGNKAYIWSIIAVQRRQPLEEIERRLAEMISGVERWRAVTLAQAWRPDPTQCENMENSEYFSIAQVAEADPAPAEVLAAAEAGDARAAFLAYQQATTDVERREWICIAANRDLPEAQAEIARLHLQSPGNPPNPFAHYKYKAYIWSIIAIHRHQPLEDMERRLGWMVTEGERWWAMALAVAWRPDPGQCESIENSEYFSIVPVTGTEASF